MLIAPFAASRSALHHRDEKTNPVIRGLDNPTSSLLLKHFLVSLIPTCKLMQHSHRRELGTRERKKIMEKRAKVKVGS